MKIFHQLLFIYKECFPGLRVFVMPSTKSIKSLSYIQALEEKQKIWYKMLMKDEALQQPLSKLHTTYTHMRFLFKLLLIYQSEAFS